MKKIIAIGGSSSRNSINKQLAVYAANLFKNAEVEVLDLNDFEMPVFSVDKEKEQGIHSLAHDFYAKLRELDDIGVELIIAGALSDEDPVGLAVMNRMIKAAGFKVIDV